MEKSGASLHIVAIDCCDHILASLGQLPALRLTTTSIRKSPSISVIESEIDLLVLGLLLYPLHRFFISQLRHSSPTVAILVLRQEEGPADFLRGEFFLSDQRLGTDIELLKKVSKILPFPACQHTAQAQHYGLVREVLSFVGAHYHEEKLTIDRVAQAFQLSPARLARLLNQQVGVGFRQLLRQIRIETAKQLLVSPQYSVKEIAAQVGFADSHYFSRSFQQVMGCSPSEYRAQNTSLSHRLAQDVVNKAVANKNGI